MGYLYATNGLALGIAQTTNPWIVLTMQTATTNASYDVFGTTNMVELALPVLSRTNWMWLTRANGGATNFPWGLTNWCERYFQLGTTTNSDHDSLTDAYENLVSHTSPTNANSPQAIYEGVISHQSPSGWFKLNDGLLTNAISGRASLTNTGGGFENDVFATAHGAYSFANSSDRLVLGETDDPIGGGTNDAVTQGSFTLLFKTLAIRTTAKRYLLSQGTANANALAVYFDGTNSTDASLTGALRVGVGTNEQAILLDTNIVREAWYYLAVTCNETRGSNEVRWYLGQVGSPALQSSNFPLGQAKKFGNNAAVTLGNKEGSTSAYRQSPSIRGVIDQVAFWERELMSTEVNAQFNALHALFQGPSKVFDLTRWELTLPVDETNQLDNTHKPLDISTAWLNSGFKYVDPTNGMQKYFYLSNGSQMVFEAPWNGADQDTNSPPTNGSPRSELRETLANGGEFNWKPYDPATGTATNTHTLQATCRLESMPSKVIFGQIHTETPNPPSGGLAAVTLFHEGAGTSTKKIKLAVYYSPDGSVTDAGNSKDKTYDLVSGVNVGDRIDYEFKLVGTSNSTVRLTATVATNGTTLPPVTVSMSNPADSGYSGWGATNVTLYFKAGCYYPKAATNSGTAKVTFSTLTVTHQP